MRRKGGYNGREGVLPSSSFDVYEKRSKNGRDRRLLVVAGLAVLAMLVVGIRLSSGGGHEQRVPLKKHRRATALVDDDDLVATGIADDVAATEVHPFVASKRRADAHKQRSARTAPAKKVMPEAKKLMPAAKVVDKGEAMAKKATPAKADREGGTVKKALEEKMEREAAKKRTEGVAARVRAERKRKADSMRNSVVPEVSIVEEHHHVLAYYLRYWRLRRSQSSPSNGAAAATVLHIDSHADLAVPSAFLEEELPGAPGTSRALEEYSEINDFLVLGAYVGVMDHVLFVEPPWSNQFRCCVYEMNATFEFVVGLDDDEGALRVDVVGETAKLFARERFSHVFWRNGERMTGDHSRLKNLRPFRVSLVSLEHPNLGETLKYVVGDDVSKPLVLDIDLDAFATVSPGAIATKDRFRLADTQLEALYHMVWNFPNLGIEYLRNSDPNVRDSTGSDVFTARAQEQINEAAVKRTTRGEEEVMSRLGHGVERILDARGISSARKSIILSYANLIDNSSPGSRLTHNPPPRGSGKRPTPRPLDPRTQANLEAYLEQPFHVPENIEAELDFVLQNIWTDALSHLQAPSMIHLVRSPGYMPDALLPLVECRLLDFFAETYQLADVSHEDRVDPQRTACSHKPNYAQVETL